MLVRSSQHCYTVCRVLKADAFCETMLCRREDAAADALFLLVRFTDSNSLTRLLPLLSEQLHNGAFSDYLGLFSREGSLYACFQYTEGETLSERLCQNELLLPERLELAGNLLSQMALQDMPPSLQIEALHDQNITVDAALRVRFNYILTSQIEQGDADMQQICQRIRTLLQRLFADELAAKSVFEIEELLERLEWGVFSDYLSVYSAYDAACRALLARTIDRPAEPQTWMFRFWKAFKRFVHHLKPVLYGLVLGVAIWYLIYTIFQPKKVGSGAVLFQKIGSVDILDRE